MRERSRIRKVPAKVRRMESKRRGMEYASKCGVDDRSPDNVEPDNGDDIEPDGRAVHNGERHTPGRAVSIRLFLTSPGPIGHLPDGTFLDSVCPATFTLHTRGRKINFVLTLLVCTICQCHQKPHPLVLNLIGVDTYTFPSRLHRLYLRCTVRVGIFHDSKWSRVVPR